MTLNTAHDPYVPHQPAMETMPGYRSTILRPLDQLYGTVALFYQFDVPSGSTWLTIVPDGCMDLIFTITPWGVKGFFYGSIKKISRLYLDDCSICFGMRFFPGMTSVLFRYSAKELNMADPPVAMQVHFEGSLLEKMSCRATYEQRREAVAGYILWHTLQSKELPPIVRFGLQEIMSQSGSVPIDSLVQKSGYTSRYFRKAFLDHVGFSPKYFSEIIKFQRTFTPYPRREESLGNVAQSGGYYDQSQMNKAYRKLADCAPSRLPEIIYAGGEHLKTYQVQFLA